MSVLLFLGLLCTSFMTQALEVTGLGRVLLPVEDRSQEAREQVFQQAFEQVLVRLSGQREVVGRPELASALQQPSRWILQYGYEESLAGEADEEDTAQLDESSLQLAVRFDVQAVSSLLTKSGLPVLGSSRPAVLLWLVRQYPGTGELVADGQGDVQEGLYQQARYRGLPLILPAMDGRDRGAIRAADIRGAFDEAIASASERYQAELVIAAILYVGNTPSMRWRLLRQGEEIAHGEVPAGQQGEQQLTAQLVDMAADYVASQYAYVPGQAQPVSLVINDISGLPVWVSMQKRLAALSGVQDVKVVVLEGTSARLHLQYTGDLPRLRRLLALEPNLEPCAQVEGGRARLEAQLMAETVQSPMQVSGQSTESSEDNIADSMPAAEIAPVALEYCVRNQP